jgi:hypothetical protein
MRLYNADHQPVVVDHALPAVQPGESHDFTDEQLKDGIAGVWSAESPRSVTKADLLERAQLEGIDVPSRASKTDIEELLASGQQAPETAEDEPAQPDDDKEQA